MRVIAVVAGGVFRESIRDRIGYGLVFFAVLLIAASFLLAQLTAGQDVKIVKDLGLAASSAIGVLIAIFYGIGLVTKEVERRSIYSLLSKPITRAQFITGKYVGLVITLLINLAVMTIAMYLVLALLDWTTLPILRGAQGAEAAALDPRMLKAVILIGVELMVMTAVAMFFSTFSGSFLSAGCALAFYVIGHFGEDLKHLDNLVHSRALAVVGRGLYYLLPNLGPLDVKADVVHGIAVSGSHMLMASLSSGLYIGVLLLASTLIFSRRDLK
jgi:ABC-type transport system involved in multi-copper enzyme maturation permease subunit